MCFRFGQGQLGPARSQRWSRVGEQGPGKGLGGDGGAELGKLEGLEEDA